eukprot:gene18241-20061_t
MTSVVDMRYTLLAPSTVQYDSGNESCASEDCLTNVKLENDPYLGFDLGLSNNDIKRLEDQLSRYGVTDLMAASEKLIGDMPVFPELCFDSEETSSENEFLCLDIDSMVDSISKFDCCCSEQCRSYDSSSDWGYQCSPRSFGNLSDDENLSPLSSFESTASYLDRRKSECGAGGNDSCGLSSGHWEPSSPVQIKKEVFDESDSIAPSPSQTDEDDEDTSSDWGCNYMTRVSDAARGDSRLLAEKPKKRRRLNSLSSDSDQSEVSVKEPPTRKRPTKMRSDNEGKSGSLKPRQLYQFLMDLLRDEDYCPEYIEWVSRDEMVFRLVDSAAVARMWGECKNRENMTYEKMSRALRYYYENGILERVPNCRLHYRFGKAAYDEYASTW